MRDDRMKWTALPEVFLPVRRDGVVITPRDIRRQYLVSGVSTGTHGDSAEWPDVVEGDAYAVRISRDQSLRAGGDAIPTGWQAKTLQAVSDMSGGFQVFDVTGPLAFDTLCRGAELDLNLPSPSVARRLWGMRVLLYRHGNDTTFRLHVERSFAMPLYAALITAADQAEAG